MSEAYPTFLAGQRITASLLSSGQPMVARKTADTSRAAVTAATADPHLQFQILANAVYIMDGWLKFDGPAAADINLDWSGPSGILGEWVAYAGGHSPMITFSNTGVAQLDTQGARGYPMRTETNDITSARSYGTLGTGLTPLTMSIYGTIRNGSTAGTYSMDWAQLISDAGNTTIYTDSWLRLQRIA